MSEAQTALFSYDDGRGAVDLAREAVDLFVNNGQRKQPGSMRDAFYNRAGVFIRLQATQGRGRLRGCAGTVQSTERVGHTIIEAAIQAASTDSCGSELEAAELSSTAFSVCIVTDVIPTDDPAADLEVGTHGLAVQKGRQSGWLYPTVPVENGWSEFEYLDRTCRKAGLSPTAWEKDDVDVLLFHSQVFEERTPNGSIKELTF
ncbi:TIGR00296 family protein [Haladaptatus sp. CMSO5]|uniref:TIGR00296 family protein n=1 Tax=Haladaptatus sp. CMSO5 TaxID=3120514 RepID=UPI002FCE47F9